MVTLPVSSAAVLPPPRMARIYDVNRQPLLWAAFAFSAGIVAGSQLWRPPLWWLLAASVFFLFALYFGGRRVGAARGLVLAALFACGAMIVQPKFVPAEDAGALSAYLDGGEVQVTAHVLREGELKQESSGEVRQTLDVATEEISREGQTRTVHSGLRMSFYAKSAKDSALPDVHVPLRLFRYGERLRFSAKLSWPRNFRNPGAFDYRGYLGGEGISALGSAKAEQVEVLPGFAGSLMELWRAKARRHVIQQIQAVWPTEQAGLIAAMLLGEESFLDRPLRTDFQRTGTYHVLVVSGLKVGILALAISWLLRRLRVPDAIASAMTLLLVVAYALLTGVGAPVWRATLMLALYFGARLVYRQRATLNTIGAAALALLLIDPAQLLGASFQLSFLCVLVIAGIAMPLVQRTTQPCLRALRHLEAVSYDVYLPPRMAQIRLDLRMIAGRLAKFIGTRLPLRALGGGGQALLLCCDFLLISAVIQIGLTLPMVYYFHRATLVSLPANVVAVPLTEIIMVAAIAGLGLASLGFGLAKIPMGIAFVAAKLTSAAVRWFGELRLADARVATPEVFVALAGVATLVLAMITIRRRPLLACGGLAALMATAVWICAVAPHPQITAGVLEVTSIDVGQGDSTLLVLPQGKTFLVDAGGTPQWMHSELDIGEDVVSPYLWSRGISRLDTVAVTHAHADHIGGMNAVLANFRPRELWIGVNAPSRELQELLREARQLGITVVRHTAGEKLSYGGSTIRILAPDSESHSSKPNDECLVMKISVGNTSALLEADAEKATEREIAEEEPKADLLKVAHHGSATSTLPELLAAVQPRMAVISVGARNVYGHPRWEVLKRLAEFKVATYRTDLDGAMSFYLDGKNVRAGPAGR